MSAAQEAGAAKRVAIIGTSNTIMKDGWRPFFERLSPEWSFVNFSVGGSCALFMPGQIDIHNIVRDFDLCVFELPVNDQRYVDTGFLSVEAFTATVTAMLAAFAAPDARCRPVVLSLPVRTTFSISAPRDSTLRALGGVCAAMGVAMLDVAEVLRAACCVAPRITDEFFSDGLHLKPAVQRHVAATLARRIKENWPPAPRPSAVLTALAPKFSAHPATRFPTPAPPQIRQTSLCAWPVLRLAQGERLQIAARGYFCGLLHWTDATSGSMVFQAGGAEGQAVRKSLRKQWPGGLFFFTHLNTPLATNGALTLVCADTPTVALEPSINPGVIDAGADIANEVAFLLFADSDPHQAGARILAATAALPDRKAAWMDQRLATQLSQIALDK